MSPACSHSRGLVRGRLRALLAAFTLLIAGLALAAGPAQAAPVTMSFTDPAGDTTNNSSAVDLISGSATFDSATGAVSVSETSAAPFGSTEGVYFFGLGHKTDVSANAPDGCDYQTQDVSNILFLYAPIPGVPSPANWLPVTTNDGSGAQTAALTQTGATITMTATDPQGLLKGKSFSCLSVQTTQSGTDGATDSAVAFLDSTGGSVPVGTGTGTGTGTGSGTTGSSGTSGTKSTTLVPVTAPVTTTAPDRDRDGVADAADGCPTIPGAQKNGCPTMPPALEVRLGAARVAIDKLVARSAAKCPSTVTVKVTAKGKSVGSGKVSTSQFGGYCRVYGAVKIKITKKVKAVRVVMKATGLGGIAKSAHR